MIGGRYSSVLRGASSRLLSQMLVVPEGMGAAKWTSSTSSSLGSSKWTSSTSLLSFGAVRGFTTGLDTTPADRKHPPTSPQDSRPIQKLGGAADKLGETHYRAQPKDYLLFHPVYTEQQVNNVHFTHREVQTFTDKAAYNAVKFIRKCFDLVTGYIPEHGEEGHPHTPAGTGVKKTDSPATRRIMTETSWMTRFIFLETIAAVPGFMAAMVRHLRALRTMKRDYGWIRTLLEEAENERMHLLTFLTVGQPGWFMRLMVLGAQGVFVNSFFAIYLVWPQFCHRFVGYIEEEAVRTYTHAVHEIDAEGLALSSWKNKPAPDIAVTYWRLKEGATMRDVILAIRADEANHRDVNHTLAGVPQDAPNPF